MTSVERTHRWRVAFAFVLFTSTAGLYLEAPIVFLTSILGVAYAGYPLFVGPPTVDLELSRTVTDETPDHGDPVTVTVTITNTGPRTLADLRIIDGVPSLLTVTDGTPRHTATLRPGASTTFQYTVAAKHGSHRFTPTTVIAHDISGNTRVETEVAAGEQSTIREELECMVDLRAFQLHRQARQYAGQTPAEAGESGLEFQQIRAYQRGDSMHRINWKRYARTGELTTMEFREEHRTAVVLCVDARQSAIRAAASTEPHAVAYCVAAAQQVCSTLEQQSEQVGAAIFGSEFNWRAPSTGREHYAHIDQLLVDHEYDQPVPIDGDDITVSSTEQVQELIAQTQGNTEVIVFSPLVDGFGETAAQQLDAHGYSVTVISPDVTTDETVSEEFVRVERANRVQMLRNRDMPVADWSPEKPLVWPVGHHRGVR
ncbi:MULTISPECIES: DUF58 domain-containing protein [Halococcus]|uniref:DUF58 domain-containing protein n=1 Tax=Halococcus salifodinae DSM 8989 TaxID=1227456 RepID=M0N073_9EURY|nr:MULTISPECIES: DUF58 domain-containing protein [Halococcus]EMA51271.1 hypothetical protein C450_12375 [Halococcus salifodinae DSM 8989]